MQHKLNPIRKISRSHSNLRGITPSEKNGTINAFESSLERDYFKILEFDNLVHEYVEQPIEILFNHNDSERHYTPDVLVYLQSIK